MSKLKKINIGCGISVLPGFDNIDNSPSVFLARHPVLKWLLCKMRVLSKHHYEMQWPRDILWQDATKRLRYPSNSVDIIYSSHFLEHAPYPKAIKVLRECHRVLKPGGLFRLVVPDLLYHTKKYVEETEKLILTGQLTRDAHDAFLETVYGKYITGKRSAHCYMYDWPTLSLLLTDLGFKDVTQREFGESADNELAALDNRPEDSLFVEMTV